MSSSVRSRMNALSEDQLDQTLAEEEQGASARDEGKADDGDGRTRQHLGHLALAGAADEHDAEGGEPTRPGAERVAAEAAAARVVPAMRALGGTGIPVSLDSTQPDRQR